MPRRKVHREYLRVSPECFQFFSLPASSGFRAIFFVCNSSRILMSAIFLSFFLNCFIAGSALTRSGGREQVRFGHGTDDGCLYERRTDVLR